MYVLVYAGMERGGSEEYWIRMRDAGLKNVISRKEFVSRTGRNEWMNGYAKC